MHSELADNLRLFLFHTAPPSGVFPVDPLVAELVRCTDSRSPLPDFATRRGFGASVAEVPARAVAEPGTFLSGPSLVGAEPTTPLVARNFLFTETALNDIGFFREDAERE